MRIINWLGVDSWVLNSWFSILIVCQGSRIDCSRLRMHFFFVISERVGYLKLVMNLIFWLKRTHKSSIYDIFCSSMLHLLWLALVSCSCWYFISDWKSLQEVVHMCLQMKEVKEVLETGCIGLKKSSSIRFVWKLGKKTLLVHNRYTIGQKRGTWLSTNN